MGILRNSMAAATMIGALATGNVARAQENVGDVVRDAMVPGTQVTAPAVAGEEMQYDVENAEAATEKADQKAEKTPAIYKLNLAPRLENTGGEVNARARLSGLARAGGFTLAGMYDAPVEDLEKAYGKIAARGDIASFGNGSCRGTLQAGIADVITPAGHTPAYEVALVGKAGPVKGWVSYDHPVQGGDGAIFAQADLELGAFAHQLEKLQVNALAKYALGGGGLQVAELGLSGKGKIAPYANVRLKGPGVSDASGLAYGAGVKISMDQAYKSIARVLGR